MLSIITFSASDTEAIVGWAGTLVGDVMPLLIVIFGITIGAYIIRVILNLKG